MHVYNTCQLWKSVYFLCNLTAQSILWARHVKPLKIKLRHGNLFYYLEVFYTLIKKTFPGSHFSAQTKSYCLITRMRDHRLGEKNTYFNVWLFVVTGDFWREISAHSYLPRFPNDWLTSHLHKIQ